MYYFFVLLIDVTIEEFDRLYFWLNRNNNVLMLFYAVFKSSNKWAHLFIKFRSKEEALKRTKPSTWMILIRGCLRFLPWSKDEFTQITQRCRLSIFILVFQRINCVPLTPYRFRTSILIRWCFSETNADITAIITSQSLSISNAVVGMFDREVSNSNC